MNVWWINPFKQIVWCYGEYQVGYADMARDMPFVQLHESRYSF